MAPRCPQNYPRHHHQRRYLPKLDDEWLSGTLGFGKNVGLRNKKCKVTPLVSMNIATLERACSAMQKMTFSDIMEDRIREDRNLGRPFEAASTFVPRGTPRNFHTHIEIMKELGERMRIDFGMYE